MPEACLRHDGRGTRSSPHRRRRFSNARPHHMLSSLTLRASLVSLALFGVLIGLWHVATMGSGAAVKMDPAYAKLMGATATQGKSAMPGPADVAAKIWQ